MDALAWWRVTLADGKIGALVIVTSALFDMTVRFDREDVDQLVKALLLLKNEDDVRAFLKDLCTPREICDFAQRLTVARFLDAGEPYVEVQARTGASSTTVSRVSKALNGESGGYRRVLIELDDAK